MGFVAFISLRCIDVVINLRIRPAGRFCFDSDWTAKRRPAPAGDSENPATPPPPPAAAAPSLPDAPRTSVEHLVTPDSTQQPKRILGVMTNFRAVSPGTVPPPPTFKQAFQIATQNSFDYSSFIFVGITSALVERANTHPQLGKVMSGFGQ